MWSELGSTCFGGGGSGGRITIVTKSEISLNNFQVSGLGIDGEGTNQSSEPGNDGTIYYFQEWISSPSHPNENHWYLDSSPIIQFNPQSQFHGCFYVFDQNPNTTANQSSQYTNENFVTLEELTEGEWFFHGVLVDESYNVIPSSHWTYKINIHSNLYTLPSHPQQNMWYENQNIV